MSLTLGTWLLAMVALAIWRSELGDPPTQQQLISCGLSLGSRLVRAFGFCSH